MFLALAEMRRAKVRFGLLMVAVALLVFLILFQQSLQNGLLTGFVGGIRNQSAPVLVFSVDGRRNIQGSVITPDLEAKINAAEGIGESGRLGQGTFTVQAGNDLQDAAIIGYERGSLGAPTTLIEGRLAEKEGEAVASDVDGPAGFALGDTVTLDPGGYRITVVGVARDVQLLVTATLFTTYDTYVAAVKARNPDAGTPLPNLIAMRPAPGVSNETLVRSVNAQSDGADALTRADAAGKTPGVSQVRTSFLVIFLLYGLVVPFVTGLFFLIITFQKAGALTLLRAIGAPASKLVAALFIQVVAVIGLGYLIGLALYFPISQQKLGGIHLRFETSAVVFWFVALFVFGLASAWFSVRRVLRIDPVEATAANGNGAIAMRLALRELRRRPGRFVTATGILTLIALLLMFLGGLVDGLIGGSTGAIRAQRGDVIVFSSTARNSLLRSRIDPGLRAKVQAVQGVTEVGGLGIVQLGVRIPGKGVRDLADAALFGIEVAPKGIPDIPPAGQAYADEVLKERGVKKGMTVELGPARTPVTVIGFVNDTSYLGQGGIWASPATWRQVLSANRPDENLADGVFQALVVSGDGAPAGLARDIDAATAGATSTLGVDAAANAIPGVKEQRGTFNQIISVTIAIAVVVVALFFALLTVERTALYGVLKAVGAASRTLFAGIVLQAVIVTLVASAIAATLAVLAGAAIPPGSIPFAIGASRLLSSVVLLLVATVVGCAFSLRRVLRVDPATAIGTGS